MCSCCTTNVFVTFVNKVKINQISFKVYVPPDVVNAKTVDHWSKYKEHLPNIKSTMYSLMTYSINVSCQC